MRREGGRKILFLHETDEIAQRGPEHELDRCHAGTSAAVKVAWPFFDWLSMKPTIFTAANCAKTRNAILGRQSYAREEFCYSCLLPSRVSQLENTEI